MAPDLFISHSTKDKTISDAICAALEGAGIRCWIAPRDVQPGRSFAGEINRAIQQSKVMVLIFSAHSNNSDQVLREVQLAVNAHLHIVQFRLEDVRLNDDLGYYLSTPHWLDAMQPPLENHIHRLTTSIKVLLDAPSGETVTSAPAEPQTPAPVAQPVADSPPPAEKRNVRGTPSLMHEGSTPAKVEPARPSPVRTFVLAGAIVALLAAGVLGGWWFGVQQPRQEAERQRQIAGQQGKDQRENEARERQTAEKIAKEKEAARQQAAAEQERLAREAKAKRDAEVEQERLAGEKKAKADADAEKERLAGAQRAKEEEAKKKTDSLKAVAAATKAQPYENSLGMRFVPVPGVNVLFSIWETRVKDFEAFVNATGHKAEGGMYSLEKGGWKQAGKTWKDPGFEQTGVHAVCGVNWEDATAFCEWLTKEERKAGRLSTEQSYRLPSDLEWSAAVGLEKESGGTPEKRDMKVKGIYPWGSKWPPPKGVGNYDPSLQVDDHKETSPVGSFEANQYGLYDLGGNVWEWCEDWWNAEKKYRVLRGASWHSSNPDYLLSSSRSDVTPGIRYGRGGFRCVLVVESSR